MTGISPNYFSAGWIMSAMNEHASPYRVFLTTAFRVLAVVLVCIFSMAFSLAISVPMMKKTVKIFGARGAWFEDGLRG